MDDNTIVVFTTDNGTENFTWPDGGQTPFAEAKGTGYEGGFRVPAIIRWPGHVPADTVENGIISGLDWFPTFVAAAGNPNINEELLKGKTDRRPDLQEPSRRLQPDGHDHRQGSVGSPRNLLLRGKQRSPRCASTTSSIASSTSPAAGWATRTIPTCRFSSTSAWIPSSARAGRTTGRKVGSQQYFDWFKYEFWRFVFVQQVSGQAGHDGHRVSADAEGRELQPRCRESEDRGSHEGTTTVVGVLSPKPSTGPHPFHLVRPEKGCCHALRRGGPPNQTTGERDNRR